MWLSPIMHVLALSAIAPQAPTDPPGTAPAQPAAIYWRQTLFAIPFHVEQPDRITQVPTEVQLYVSGDRGVHWDLYAKVPPTQKRFLFRAGADGEYWFCVRTVDRSGQIRPQGAATPGLRVVVDTTPPKLQLDARRGDGGQIVVRWQVEEPAIKPDSLTIQYRTGPTAAWQAVALGRQDIGTAAGARSGEVTWLAPAGAGPLAIRGEVSDLAGNPAVTQVVLAENRAAATGTSAPRSTDTSVTPQASDPRATDPRGTANPGVPPGTLTADATKQGNDWQAGTRDAPPTNWPAENTQTANRPAYDLPNGQGGAAGPAAAPNSGGRTEVALSVDGQKLDSANGVAIRVHPPIRSQFTAPEERAGNPGANAATNTGIVSMGSGVPVGERVRWVSEREFELTYESESVGPSGVARAELWGTRDGGRTWRSFGVDDGKRNRIVVTADEEGIYGFRIAIQNGTGAGGGPPRSGAVPETWIGVDLTKPAGRITGVEPGTGDNANRLTIVWEASDNQKLSQRAITLAFSETLGGPWTPIATGLENTGRYTWTLDNHAPQRVYLRLEVRDEAGNIGTYETPLPVSLDHSVPSARIRDVRPLGQSGAQGQPKYYLR